ncbi:MAG TPA: tetratricopeptide repeat protein [Steroidobacteraceae bacterium]
MSLTDCRGIPVSTSDRGLLHKYEQAVDLLASYFLDPLEVIEEMLNQEPSFAAAHCVRAALAVGATDRSLVPMLKESVAAVEALGKRANDRERAHIAAARKWLEGDFEGSVRAYGNILLDYPRDLLALQAAHLGDFYLGASTMLRDRVAQILPYWDANTPGYGYVLGMYAFGLEETALYAKAEDTGRRALELNRRDPWAVHAVAHVMEMQGRLRDGIEWLSSREADWSRNNAFAYHNWWHLGLYYLDLGETGQVLDLYDKRIRPMPSQVPLEMIDASAMLWRLGLRNIDVGTRWERLADSWAPVADHAYYAFNDVHAVMAFVGAQRFEAAERVVKLLERKAQEADTNAMMSRDVGLPIANALIAFGRGDYAGCIDSMLPVRTIANRFGGSNAQRDLIHLTLVEAALRARNFKLARALISERTQLKPTSPWNWQLTARSMEIAGDEIAASKARENAESRRKAQLAVA